MTKIIVIIITFLFTTSAFSDQAVYAYDENDHVYYFSKIKNKVMQLTFSGIDHHTSLSPDGRWIAFTKRSKNIIPDACAFSSTKTDYANQLWIYDLKLMKKRLLVVDNFACDHPTKVIIDPSDLQFSPDSKTLYFETSAWATSGALHAIDITGKNLRFVTDCNEYRVVMHGRYKGDIVATQHRYHFKGNTPLGSYDWEWLFTPMGKQIKLYKKKD